MCILLQFPSPNDPRPEPPVPSMRMLRPIEAALTNAASVHALPSPAERARLAFSVPQVLRVTA